MRYVDIKKIDVANGPGVRMSLWVAGCPHHCKGCFNVETWDYSRGQPFTNEIAKYIIEYLKICHINGLSILGGEPLAQDDTLVDFLRQLKTVLPNVNIWCYTGYIYDKVITHPALQYIDVLVDGPFILEQKKVGLQFRGSTNQRIIDVKKSLMAGEIVLWADNFIA